MRKYKTNTITSTLIILLGLFAFTACSGDQKDKSVAKKDTDLGGEEAIREESEVSAELSDLSIYHLPSTWTSHRGKEMQLEELKGKVVVMVMIYTTCKAACPRLIADMQSIKKVLPEDRMEDLQMVLVSIDPEVDTPERLETFSKESKMYDEPWLFLRGSEEDTREFAAVLAVNYKRISPIDFSHSNIISVFNREGELEHQQEGLGVNNDKTIEAIKRLLASDS